MRIEDEINERLENERAYDAEWIKDNICLFDPLAREGFSTCGRGAIVVNVTELIQRKYSDEGHPFNYRSAENTDWLEPGEFWVVEGTHPDEVRGMMQTYDPANHFIVVLEKFVARSAYQVPLLGEDEIDQEVRGAYVDAEADERQNRLTAPDPWGRDFRLATTYAPLWRVK